MAAQEPSRGGPSKAARESISSVTPGMEYAMVHLLSVSRYCRGTDGGCQGRCLAVRMADEPCAPRADSVLGLDAGGAARLEYPQQIPERRHEDDRATSQDAQVVRERLPRRRGGVDGQVRR